MLCHRLQALPGEVCPQHAHLVVHPAGHPAVFLIRVHARIHRQGGQLFVQRRFLILHAVHQAQVLPDDRRRQHHALECAVQQHAHPQFRHQRLGLPQQVVVERNKYQSVGDVCRADGIHHTGHKSRVVVHGGFHFQLDRAALHAPAQGQCLGQGGDLLIFIGNVLPAAEVQVLQLAFGHVVDTAGNIGVQVDDIVVVDHKAAVQRLLYVHFHTVGPDLHRLAEGRQRVFRCQIGCATVRNDLRYHKQNFPFCTAKLPPFSIPYPPGCVHLRIPQKSGSFFVSFALKVRLLSSKRRIHPMIFAHFSREICKTRGKSLPSVSFKPAPGMVQ